MVAALFLALLAACFLTGLGLRILGLHWIVAWFIGSLFLPIMVSLAEIWWPSGYPGIALFFGAIVGATLSGIGVLVGWLVMRKRGTSTQATRPS